MAGLGAVERTCGRNQGEHLRALGTPRVGHRRILDESTLMPRVSPIMLAALFCWAASVAQADERIDLPTRPGITQRFYFTAAASPRRSAVLFVGARGEFGEAARTNFLARVASSFVAQGISVAIPDVPSDHADGMTDGFRASAEHATDVAAVITFLQQRAAVPVWLVGTSRGTIPAASVAARLGPPHVAGLVLTSTVWPALRAVTSLGQVQVPTLVVHNRNDGCQESPFSAAADGVAALTHAPAKDFVAISGGRSLGPACRALSPHGFYGIEDQVVPPITAWIQTH